MNANKAKRRLLKWMRYIDNTNSQSNHKNNAGYHTAHARAYTDASYAGRAAPHGIRTPWVRTSRPGGA